MVVVDRFVDGVGVDLANAVAVDRHRNMFVSSPSCAVIVGNAFLAAWRSALVPTRRYPPSAASLTTSTGGMVLRNVGQRPEPFPGLVLTAPLLPRGWRLAQHFGNIVRAAAGVDASVIGGPARCRVGGDGPPTLSRADPRATATASTDSVAVQRVRRRGSSATGKARPMTCDDDASPRWGRLTKSTSPMRWPPRCAT